MGLSLSLSWSPSLIVKQRNDRLICDGHLIWRLRNILADSGRFTSQFVAHALPTVPLTVPNLIKVHYWYLLLTLTFLNTSGYWKWLIGDRLDDPFNILGDSRI